MRVRIVSYDESWILGKFVFKLQENLLKLNIECDISNLPDKTADINHYIIYPAYNSQLESSIDTLMITHIDRTKKKDFLKQSLQTAHMGICMSNETMSNLVNLGIPREKLCYINPAHDGVIIPRPKIIGITCRVQTDGRKREEFLSKLAKQISPKQFSFKIMGDGWEKQVEDLKKEGFYVEYTCEFNYSEYTKLIPSLDYYLYMGQDEGQMGFIDALAAGVETIVTPQGYHLDAIDGISYPFNSYDDLLQVFQSISKKRETLINSVSTWNWMDYTKKHVEVWKYCIAVKNRNQYKYEKQVYHDGINSVEQYADNELLISKKKKNELLFSLFKGTLRHKYFVNIKKTNKK